MRLLDKVHAAAERNGTDVAQAILGRLRTLVRPREFSIALSIALSALAVLTKGDPEILVDALPLKDIFDDVLADMGGPRA